MSCGIDQRRYTLPLHDEVVKFLMHQDGATSGNRYITICLREGDFIICDNTIIFRHTRKVRPFILKSVLL